MPLCPFFSEINRPVALIQRKYRPAFDFAAVTHQAAFFQAILSLASHIRHWVRAASSVHATAKTTLPIIQEVEAVAIVYLSFSAELHELCACLQDMCFENASKLLNMYR